jgi:hypothetical protein
VADHAEAKREIGVQVRDGNHFAYRKLGHKRERVMPQLESRGPGPGALDPHVLEVVSHQLADARSPVHMGDDLERVVRLGERTADGLDVESAMLVAHRGGRHAHAAVVKGTDKRVLVDRERGTRELFGKTSQLTPTGDRRLVVQGHGMHLGTTPSAEMHRNHLTRLGVVAEPRGVGHADELVLDDRLVDLQRLRDHGPQRVVAGAVRHDEILALDEALQPRRKRGARHRHSECANDNLVGGHVFFPQGRGTVLFGAVARRFWKPWRRHHFVAT